MSYVKKSEIADTIVYYNRLIEQYYLPMTSFRLLFYGTSVKIVQSNNNSTSFIDIKIAKVKNSLFLASASKNLFYQ